MAGDCETLNAQLTSQPPRAYCLISRDVLVRIRKEGKRDDCLECQLWLQKCKYCSRPFGWGGRRPGGITFAHHNLWKAVILKGRPWQTPAYSFFKPRKSRQPMSTLSCLLLSTKLYTDR